MHIGCKAADTPMILAAVGAIVTDRSQMRHGHAALRPAIRHRSAMLANDAFSTDNNTGAARWTLE